MNKSFTLYIAMLVGVISVLTVTAVSRAAALNLAVFARTSTSYVSPHETLTGINGDFDPANSNDKTSDAYGNWPKAGTQWVEYRWDQPISTAKIDVFWFVDHGGVLMPTACRLYYWDGNAFVRVSHPSGLGLIENQYNTTTFDEVKTSRLRLEMDSQGTFSTGILQWKVYDSGNSPHLPPIVKAGIDRDVVLPGATYLVGFSRGCDSKSLKLTWSKAAGPGAVTFADANAAETRATFSSAGNYVLMLTADDGIAKTSDTLSVVACEPPPVKCLQAIEMSPWKVQSPVFSERTKTLIVHWLPHCVEKLSDPKLSEGGIENFTQAGNKLAGRPYSPSIGPVFTNGWVYATFESLCYALMVDPQGDAEIINAQQRLRATVDDWVPKMLSAQEPDGYLQTFYTLNNLPRWTNKADHEGYTAGYFIESAIAHYQMTDRKDPRMYNAAKKLADCWYAHVGPSSKWYDGHEELEQALVRLAHLVNGVDGPGKGDKYIQLAKRLLDNRGGGDLYDQSHLPVTRQYEALGHAVRAVYCYTGVSAVATETGDVDYLSAVHSLWDNIVNRKYYLTGGVGSGETSEGFGKNYSLPNHAYCESCSGCGELFFQHTLQLAYHDSRYADLYEQTLYNAILGDFDLKGENFYYANPLDSSEARYPWHVCPCCVGNFPRTILQLPTWMYSKDADSIYVNLFVGSTVNIPNVQGANVRMTQTTDYPWSGKISLSVNPSIDAEFNIKIRIPSADVSELYTSTPVVHGFDSLRVNGKAVMPVMENGYAVIHRTWRAGDRIDLVLPMQVQRVRASDKVAADKGLVALRYGPVVYNIESVDQNLENTLDAKAELKTEWRSDLLGGVMTITGTFANGQPLLAIPNYARNNRGGRSIVWIKERN